MIQIEKNIPMPNIGTNGRKRKYPFDKLEVGDSFLIECEDSYNNNNKFNQNCNSNGKKLGMVFKFSRVENGYRIWRIS